MNDGLFFRGRTLFADCILADGDLRIFVFRWVFCVVGDHGIGGLIT